MAAKANPYVQGGLVALKMFAAGEAAKANQENDIRQAKIAQQQRKVAFNRESQAYLHNQNQLKDQNTSDNFNISIAEASARDQLASATAGNGLAGNSVNEMQDEITREVSRDRVAKDRQLKASQDAMNQERIQSNENRVVEASNAYVHDYTADLKGALFDSVGSALLM
jgi:hypothetical protein